jgi:PKD repeat protein/type 1 glutamine amidotransferase/glucose/arabinose dehydrogenase
MNGGGSAMREECRSAVALGATGHVSGALRALLTCAALALALALFGTSSAHAQTDPVKVLLFHGPQDPTTQPGIAAFEALAADNDFDVDATADPAEFTADNLAQYRAVVFMNTAGDLLDDEQEAAMTGFVEDGGGFLGIGSAAQSEPGADFFDGLIGSRPSASSSTAESPQTVAVGDRVHPATRGLDLEWDRTDVWYQWQSRPTGSVHTVARYHAPDAPAGDGTDIGGTDHPISWCRDYRGGRSFYTGMGRTAGSFSEADFRTHLLGAVKWTTGLVRADCKATISSNYKASKIVSAADLSVGLRNSGESHGLVTAENGWVLYIGRGDCRTDQERGALLGGGATGRILDHADPNVGIGCGNVHIWDPAAANGTLNSGVTRAGTLAVYGDGGTGGERTDQDNHKMEYGLLGITVAPDFTETGHIYLQYFPTFNPNSTPPGLPLERRVSKMSKPRISRFTIDLETKQLDLDSEVRIFEYDAQIYSCCHVGGGMGFDSEGNLYVTTGDTNSSQGSNGYSGNNPAPKCPAGSPTEASRMHCGDARYSFQDARRTAGNTNDYNGKMLRIKPTPAIPDGTQPPIGPGTTYELPTEEDPNGPNLFDGTEGGGGKAKPEIYAMGLRNPSRLYVDPETDIPYTAWVGPDAQVPNAEQGPSTYENAAQIDRAGNYGWPYCMGNGQAYRDRVSDPTDPDNPAKVALRATNSAGYVSGGPATGGTDGWYDCNNLRNDSPNNTGLVELPHETGTGMDAGKVRPVNLWYSRGNQDNDANPDTRTFNGCPDYPRPRGADAAPNYGAVPTQLCPYLYNDGMTVMAGPVYRYDEDAADDSRRWPEYWDGRWFLHNSGGPSVKHGLLFDPATVAQGGQPVYADSLRGVLNWDAAYMDSKFGPDGALYVQVYDGFFRAGQNAGIWRFDYTGGPATPGASPQALPKGDLNVQFSSAGSGGVAYEWDFGDGSATSNDPNPVHRYADERAYTAKLTVTYEDGSKDTQEVTVNVIAARDVDPPVTTATTNPADPNGTRPVSVTLTATDGGGLGVTRTEYRVNGGAWQQYTVPFRRSEPGAYVVEYRSIDQASNVEETKRLEFTISVIENCTPNLNDEFDGATLDDTRWTFAGGRRDNAAISVADGQLALKIRAGDMIGGTATAKNVLLQDAPDGPFMVTTRLNVRDLTQEGQQAGLVLWNGESPNTFAKIVYINKGATRRFEYVATRNNAQDIRIGTEFSTAPREAYLRVRADGAGRYIAESSLDGESWERIAIPITNFGNPDSVKIGLKVSDNADAESAARFLYFRVDCSDRIEPQSTATVSPERPDGELGWYETPPTVTLAADDGPRGGVSKIEYRIDDGPVQTYGGPFEVADDGDHVIRYFATDNATEPNSEDAKTLGVRVDRTAPETEVDLDRSQGADAPVRVTLDPQDGEGSGAVLTQYRVDGGPWQTYAAEDEQIFDGTPASLSQWTQAGDGGFALLGDGSGGVSPTPSQSLGMLWYPVKPFGDFRVKLEFREGRTDGGHSNGGVFVRFPDPRIPLAERKDQCARTGAAATSPAWVAIFCGHEIQLYDGQGGETRKTGSVYTFDNNTIDQIGDPRPLGEWNDYEIEVRGQTYRIFRNGELINEYENSPDKVSDRGGDPPASQRQFAQGYIGLQNHGGPDRTQYRNIRVEDLSPDAPGRNPTGQFTVSGRGPHTVEVRSVDAAGHVEDKRAVDFEIGETAPPQPTPPPGETPQPIPPIADTPASYRLGSVAARLSAKRFAKRGLKVPVDCTGAMSGTAKLTVSRSVSRKLRLGTRTIKSVTVQCYGQHTATAVLKPSKAVARKLQKGARGKGNVRLELSVQMRDLGQPAQTTSKSVTLR